MDKTQLDIIQVVERRRKWSAEAKAQIMEEAAAGRNGPERRGSALRFPQPGLWVAPECGWARPGISMASAACAVFAPVKVEEPQTAAPSLPALPTAPAARRRASVVEIALGNGRSMKVYEDIDPAVLARLAGALDGGKR